jgi:hypothetical protein
MFRPTRCLVVAAAGLTAAVALAQQLKLRTGQWQLTLTAAGGLPVGADVPADVRAQLAAQLAHPVEFMTCVTAADLASLNLNPGGEDEDCTVTSRTGTDRSADITRTCGGDEPRTEKIHVEASSPEALTARIERTGDDGPSKVTIAGKWIAAQCTDD